VSTPERAGSEGLLLSAAEAEPLLVGLDADDDIAAAWAAEVERRIDALERGETSVKGVEGVIAAARARIADGAT
jgi:hypothetical protein